MKEGDTGLGRSQTDLKMLPPWPRRGRRAMFESVQLPQAGERKLRLLFGPLKIHGLARLWLQLLETCFGLLTSRNVTNQSVMFSYTVCCHLLQPVCQLV